MQLPFVALLAAAIIAIGGLAMLQYYWVDQVSVGERSRLQANVQLGAQRFSEDFDRELARAYLSLQMDATTFRDNAWWRYAQRVKHWRASTPYPGLISKMYLVEVNQIGRASLTRFEMSQNRFVHASWTPGLLQLRERLAQAYRSMSEEEFPQGEERRLPIIAEDLPALVVGVARSWILSDTATGIDADLLFSDLILPTRPGSCVSCQSPTSDVPLYAYMVLVLDQQYIAETMLPDLALRYFPNDSGLVYHLDVLSRSAGSVPIYRSDPHLPTATLGTGDAVVGLFDISYAKLSRLLLDGSLRLDTGANGQNTNGQRIAIGILGGEDAQSSEQGPPGHWELIIRHEAGSLDAAVAGIRMRNLLISFGTLLLLGVSVAMLVRSTRRAQYLARQQIEFASAVSHELRTPLAVICSAGENLADGLVHDPQKARQYGQVISSEGRRLTDMVEQVLAFASAQSGQRCYNLQPTSLHQVIESAVMGLEVPLREQGFHVEVAIAPDLPLVQADAIALKRSVQNLISNGLKYAQSGRWMGISAAVVEGERGSEVQIIVRDKGVGIDPVDLPHIFEPFYRGRQAHHLQTPGSGLGLSLVHHTIEAHKGHISVESIPGQGSAFTLHVPLPIAVLANAYHYEQAHPARGR
jgi:signal transduction histidine kinase